MTPGCFWPKQLEDGVFGLGVLVPSMSSSPVICANGHAWQAALHRGC